MHESRQEVFEEVLSDLLEREIKAFKSKLNALDPPQGFRRIPKGELERVASSVELNEKMLQYYDLPTMEVMTKKILQKIPRMDLVLRLEEKLRNFSPGKEINSGSVLSEEPRTRAEFLQYYVMLTLNPNTASRQLCLSEGNRKVTRSEKPQSYPDHPERYDTSIPQVLCRESLSGRSYWEVEWKGELGPDVAVTYKTNVKLFGIDYRFGNNNKSWSLKCSSSGYSVWHNNKGTKLTDFLSSSHKIGIYLDNGAGSLAFYSISDTMTLLHRVQTTFDEPLYAGFGVYGLYDATGVLMSSTVTLCQPK